METIVKCDRLTDRHLQTKNRDDNWRTTRDRYRTDRGMYDFLGSVQIPVTLFDEIELMLEERPLIRTLEGGCGEGNLPVNLKTGIRYGTRNFPGLAHKIHVVGITLSEEHAASMRRIPVPYGVDSVFIGPIQDYQPADEIDLAIDFQGAAYHFWEDAIPTYARVLKEGGQAFMRLAPANEKEQKGMQKLLDKCHLERILEEGYGCYDILVRKS